MILTAGAPPNLCTLDTTEIHMTHCGISLQCQGYSLLFWWAKSNESYVEISKGCSLGKQNMISGKKMHRLNMSQVFFLTAKFHFLYSMISYDMQVNHYSKWLCSFSWKWLRVQQTWGKLAWSPSRSTSLCKPRWKYKFPTHVKRRWMKHLKLLCATDRKQQFSPKLKHASDHGL